MSAKTDKAHKAQLLIDNPVMQEAFSTIENNILATWKRTSFDQTKEREILYTQFRELENVKGFLRLAVEHGKKETLNAEIERSIKEII